jgi:hypothetical protein
MVNGFNGPVRVHVSPQVEPPPGWEWESSWQVDHGPATDADGWAFAPGQRLGTNCLLALVLAALPWDCN